MIKYFFFFFSLISFSQNLKVKGFVKDNLNRSVSNASVLVLDENKNTIAYTYTNELGFFLLDFSTKETNYEIAVSCLGYQKEQYKIDNSKEIIEVNIILKIKTETLKEIVIESLPIKKNGDTTTIKTNRYQNQTQQTLEDILKKIPGIEVQTDGSVKAHGQYINKLLVEGDDLFDKNYKLLTKNLDAKVLDAIQILDNFEDNPILKKMISSNKVALNIKLKKDKKNVWFGNINLGSGVVSENRWKEGVNLGLLRKKVKLFYFSDYNNSGEKAIDIMQESLNEENLFDEKRKEKKTHSLYIINTNENSTFSRSQSVFNTAFLNSLSFNTNFKPSFTIRGQVFFANDKLIQDSFLETKYNVNTTPIVFSETNSYSSKKMLASAEINLKYFADERNYFTNTFIYKQNPNTAFNSLFFNNSPTSQSSKINNSSIYNHLNHTFKLNKKMALLNYFYFGNDQLEDSNKLYSLPLNNFLNANDNSFVYQNFNNKLFYFGFKSKLISKFKKFDYALDCNFENIKEVVKSVFLVDSSNQYEYGNNLSLKQNVKSIRNSFKYIFSKQINVTAGLNFIQNSYKKNEISNTLVLVNHEISFVLKTDNYGIFTLGYNKNEKIPEINTMMNNSFLTSYNNFTKGISYEKPIENILYSINHYLLKDEKRFSLSTSISYLDIKSTLGFENSITQNMVFTNYNLIKGGENYIGNFNFINYFRKINLSLKLDTNHYLSESPTKVNNNIPFNLKSYSSNYKLSGTSHFTSSLNFDFGIRYNYYQTYFNNITSKNDNKDAFLNFNYKVTKEILAEFNSTFYVLNNGNYSFLNIILNYNPIKSNRFSYRLLFNNITNENHFTITSIDGYSFRTTRINLIPRYLLLNIKYRF